MRSTLEIPVEAVVAMWKDECRPCDCTCLRAYTDIHRKAVRLLEDFAQLHQRFNGWRDSRIIRSERIVRRALYRFLKTDRARTAVQHRLVAEALVVPAAHGWSPETGWEMCAVDLDDVQELLSSGEGLVTFHCPDCGQAVFMVESVTACP